ncbi:MAG: hypothetical protein QM713_01455 [Arachnia sp.]
MRQWARNRAVLPMLCAALLAAVLAVPGSGVLVAFPSLTGGPGFAAPLSALSPLLTAIALSAGFSRQNAALESLGLRRVWLLDLAVVAVALAMAGTCVAVWGGEQLCAALRNAVGYCGLTLLSTAVLSLRTAALPAVAWAVGSAMGLFPLGDPLLTWPLAPTSAPLSWAIPLGLILVGPVAYLVRTPPSN